jgi:hypothetical protein
MQRICGLPFPRKPGRALYFNRFLYEEQLFTILADGIFIVYISAKIRQPKSLQYRIKLYSFIYTKLFVAQGMFL